LKNKLKGGIKMAISSSMNRDKRSIIIGVLVAVVILLALLLVYLFVVQPSINNYVLNKQVEAQTYVFADMVSQLQNTGAYQVQLGNQTLVLVPYQPSAQQ